MALDVRNISRIKVEDMALAGGYFVLFWLLDAVQLTAFGGLRVEALASAWPAIALLGCAGVLFRRVAPAAMAWMCGTAALGLLLAGHAGAFLLIFEFFFSLVLFGTAKAASLASRVSWVLTVLLVVSTFAMTRSAAIAVATGVLAVVTLLTPVEWAGNLRKANQLAVSEAARADAVQDAAAQRLLAERGAHELALEQERQHMARELHDVISARLSAIALQSGAALHAAAAVPTGTVPEVAGSGLALLRQIRQESVSGLAELNAMIRLLHTGALPEAPGNLGDLTSLVARYRSAGVQVAFTDAMHDADTDLPLTAQTAVYRIAAEALANAARHAPGSHVNIILSEEESVPPSADETTGQVLTLTVSNSLSQDTRGASAGTGTGIPSMHFRAAHAGGELSAGPHGTDWKVVLSLPLATPHAAASSPEQRLSSTDGRTA